MRIAAYNTYNFAPIIRKTYDKREDKICRSHLPFLFFLTPHVFSVFAQKPCVVYLTVTFVAGSATNENISNSPFTECPELNGSNQLIKFKFNYTNQKHKNSIVIVLKPVHLLSILVKYTKEPVRRPAL
jgi:hypothetical protein